MFKKEQAMGFSSELLRKIIHLFSLWIPILYLYTDKVLMLKILIPISIMVFTLDYFRKFFPSWQKIVNLIFGMFMRIEEKEKLNLSGATYLLIASSLTIALFEKEVAIFALTVLVISDSVAALVGKGFGRIRIFNKTLEGSLAFAVSAIVIYYFYVISCHFSLSFLLSIFAIVSATFVEILSKKLYIDDNLAIPMTIGAILSL